jgi:2-C-methyl-D-erythritol 4-phosphate cytidylyltransferase
MPAVLVLPAAGSGSRYGGPIAKQLLPLAGIPLLRRSLDAFAGLVVAAVVPTSDGLREQVAAALAGSPIPVRIVGGGATRQASVHAGLLATDPAWDLVLVHDAVRPLVPRRCIADCLAALASHDAAVVAIPCPDTVKRTAEGAAEVASTVPRDGLWLAQTPQGFRRDAGLAAFARAVAEGWTCSDDAQVMERAGHRVALVPGDRRNLKVTTPDDWAVAEALLAATPGGA